MNIRLREVKNILRDFLEDRQVWPEQKLWVMLRAARENGMSFVSPCNCIRGFAGRLASLSFHEPQPGSYDRTFRIPGADEAEVAYRRLGYIGFEQSDGLRDDETRNRRLVPIIRSELRRREQIRIKEQQMERKLVTA